MNRDTQDFLRQLLWLAAQNGDPGLRGRKVYDFSKPFVEELERFLQGFREFIEPHELELYRLDRAFGGSVYLSLSGHGAGFWDEQDSELGDELHRLLLLYSGPAYRFEGLEAMLCVDRNGVIDLCYLPEHLAEHRRKLFLVDEEAKRKV